MWISLSAIKECECFKWICACMHMYVSLCGSLCVPITVETSLNIPVHVNISIKHQGVVKGNSFWTKKNKMAGKDLNISFIHQLCIHTYIICCFFVSFHVELHGFSIMAVTVHYLQYVLFNLRDMFWIILYYISVFMFLMWYILNNRITIIHITLQARRIWKKETS